ncbi:MAG: FkbM family methyltransferase [Actinomycetota bacterium]|nr:FkbM family methyltransferase [Actinomycetota bacterium]
MGSFRRSTGLLRSILMYYGVPLRNRALARFYAQFVRPGDLCFDIGAHVGNRLWALSKLGARVVALEPQPQCMRLLRRWYGHHPDIELIEQAVGAAPGTRTLFVSERTPTVTTLSQNWITAVGATPGFAGVRWDRSIPVCVNTLDELIARYGEPAFCKIDVEGTELDVLRGLSHPLKALSFEYIPAATDIAVACVDRLGELGPYEYNWSPGELPRLRSSTWLGPTQMANLLQRMPVRERSGDVYARRLD